MHIKGKLPFIAKRDAFYSDRLSVCPAFLTYVKPVTILRSGPVARYEARRQPTLCGGFRHSPLTGAKSLLFQHEFAHRFKIFGGNFGSLQQPLVNRPVAVRGASDPRSIPRLASI